VWDIITCLTHGYNILLQISKATLNTGCQAYLSVHDTQLLNLGFRSGSNRWGTLFLGNRDHSALQFCELNVVCDGFVTGNWSLVHQ
jgi:hypothetical protein